MSSTPVVFLGNAFYTHGSVLVGSRIEIRCVLQIGKNETKLIVLNSNKL